jgi:hypothetical protein
MAEKIDLIDFCLKKTTFTKPSIIWETLEIFTTVKVQNAKDPRIPDIPSVFGKGYIPKWQRFPRWRSVIFFFMKMIVFSRLLFLVSWFLV